MHKKHNNTSSFTRLSSRGQTEVFEICMTEEDESHIQPVLIPSQKATNKSIQTKTSWQKDYSRPGSTNTADTTNDYTQYSHDKENIGDKPKEYYYRNIQALLDQKLNEYSNGITAKQTTGKAFTDLSNQGNAMLKNKMNPEISYASELLSNLDVNIQEFKHLLANNLNKLDPKEKLGFPNVPSDDSKVLEISRLTLKLEESKFCTENEPSELKMLKEFETRSSHPTNCSLIERSFEDLRAPDITEIDQFEKPWNFLDSRVNYSETGQNTGYTTNNNFVKYEQRIQDQSEEQSFHEGAKTLSPPPIARKTSEMGIFNIFEEDYENVFESFKKMMPEFSNKSHILRYLKGHQELSNEFLYAVMLDLKEIEKHTFLMHHQSMMREKQLQGQIDQLSKTNEIYQQENTGLHSREGKTSGRDNKSSRRDSNAGLVSTYIRKHYQSLLQRINEFYGQKLEVLKQSLISASNHNATRPALQDIFEDLVEELGFEDMQDSLNNNLQKLKEVHNLIGDMWTEKCHTTNFSETCTLKNNQSQKTANRKASADSSSTGFLTTIRQEGFECKKEETILEESYEAKGTERRLEEEQETRLNMSEIERSRTENLLREKENEISIIRKKEQIYQNMIYSLTKELKEVKLKLNQGQQAGLQNNENNKE